MSDKKKDLDEPSDIVHDIMGIVDDAMPTDPDIAEERPTVVDDVYLAELRARLDEPGRDDDKTPVPAQPAARDHLQVAQSERISAFPDHTTEKLEQELKGALTGPGRGESDSFPEAPIPLFDESLYILCGPDAGRSIQVPKDRSTLSIGRGQDCDVVLSDPSVSRRHLLLHRQGDTWTFRDLESENGTYIDGQYSSGGKLSWSRPLELGRTILVMEKGRKGS